MGSLTSKLEPSMKNTLLQVIAQAEAAAAEGGGWSTQRHYSVPTTDCALSSLPKVC